MVVNQSIFAGVQNLMKSWDRPQDVKIPAILLLLLEGFMKTIDPCTLPKSDRLAYEVALKVIADKKARIAAHQAYTEAKKAHPDDKQAAYENYRNTKELYAIGRRRARSIPAGDYINLAERIEAALQNPGDENVGK